MDRLIDRSVEADEAEGITDKCWKMGNICICCTYFLAVCSVGNFFSDFVFCCFSIFGAGFPDRFVVLL